MDNFPKTDWRAVLTAVFCGVVVAMNVGKVPIAMDALREEFSLSLVAAGWISSMINTIAVFAAVFFGLFGDRLGALRMCLAGLVISLFGGLAALLADGEAILLWSRFAEGAGLIAVAVSAPALLSSASRPEDRRFALGIWSGYLPAGVGLVMLLAPLLMPWSGWRGLWIFTQILLVAAFLALLRFRPAYHSVTPSRGPDHPFAVARAALTQIEPWLLAAAMTCWTLQHYTLIIWLPTFLKEQRGLGPLMVALLSCVMVLVNVPGNLLGGSLLQRHFHRGNLIIVANVVTASCSLGFFSDALPDWLRYALCLVMSFTGGLIPASVLSSTASYAQTPKQIGTLQGLYLQLGNIGPFIGPPLVAMLVAASGRWSDAVIVTAGAALVSIVLGWQIRRRELAGTSLRS